jgi:hypothetical protein
VRTELSNGLGWRPATYSRFAPGSGVYHAENIGEDELGQGKAGEFHSVLFGVNLARSHKHVEPTAQVVRAHDLPTHGERPSAAPLWVPARRSSSERLP